MATITNSRLLQWIGESYDSGPGNVRTYNFPPNGANQTAQVSPPNIQSIGITLPYTTASQWFVQPIAGEAFIRNRSPYWLTLVCTMATSNGVSNTVDLIIAPFQLFFIPPTITAIISITGQDIYDGNQAVATSSIQTLYIDYVVIT